jgi:hypothetical protein
VPRPEKEREVPHSMVVHESVINNFAQLELAGDAANSVNDGLRSFNIPSSNRHEMETPGLIIYLDFVA